MDYYQDEFDFQFEYNTISHHWTTQFDQFDFDQTRMIEVERDYRLQRRGKGSFHRLYRVPGNRLGFLSGDGIIDAGLADNYPIDIVISVSDVIGNTSKLVFQIVSDQVEDSSRGVGGSPLIGGNGWSHKAHGAISVDWLDGFIRIGGNPGVSYFTIGGFEDVKLSAFQTGGGVAAGWTPNSMWNGSASINAYSNQGKLTSSRTISVVYASEDLNVKIFSDDSLCQIEIPPGSLYDGMWLDLEREESFDLPGQVESVYALEPRDQPVKGPVTVKIQKNKAALRDTRWGVYYFNSKMGWTFLGRESEGEYLTGKATSLERFGLALDSDAPSIQIGLPKTASTSQSQPEFAAVISDQLSGITASNVIVKLDGRRIPAEYDQPRARVYYRPWKPLARGKHTYEIEVIDRAGNSTKKSASITIN